MPRSSFPSIRTFAMATFRAYLLNPAGRITWGDWIEARDLQEARRKASELCDGGHPTVELWQGLEKLGDVACDEDQPATSRG